MKNLSKSNRIIIIILVLSIVGWFVIQAGFKSGSDNQKTVVTEGKVNNLSPLQFQELAQTESVFLLDVHTPEQTHIPGTDALIPDTKIEERIQELPADKNTPIAVYCRSGSMSSRAAKKLIALGYTNVSNLEGGLNAYKESVLEEISITPARQELGEVIYGDVETTTFTLTNFTADTIKISRVSTSCGCTKAEIDTEELFPYSSTEIQVSFDPAVHKDDSDLGDLTRTIYIETDHPDFPKLEAEITATVVKK